MIYLDSCLVIYLMESTTSHGELMKQLLANYRDEVFAISPLVKLECLVAPFKLGDAALETRYREVFTLFRQVTMTDAVYEEAARLRGCHGLKTPDALHLAAAKQSGCAALWTNDRRLATVAPDYAMSIVDVLHKIR